MSEFHDDYPQYELMAHHSEEVGMVTRKKLWRVFWYMLFITILELVVGFNNHYFSKLFLMFFFIGFTIIKASFIVLAFMHLGDEKKVMKWVILAPFTVFIIYLVYIVTTEGSYSLNYRMKMDAKIMEQKANEGHENHHEENSHQETHHQE